MCAEAFVVCGMFAEDGSKCIRMIDRSVVDNDAWHGCVYVVLSHMMQDYVCKRGGVHFTHFTHTSHTLECVCV